MVFHMKARFLAHGLEFAHKLTHKALFDERFRQLRINGHRHAAVLNGEVPVRLRHLDEQVLRRQFNGSPL